MFRCRRSFFGVWASLAAVALWLQRVPVAYSAAADGAYILKLSPETARQGNGLFARNVDQHALFGKRAVDMGIDFTVRQEFRSDVYLGLSITLTGHLAPDEAMDRLRSVPGVVDVTPVYDVHIPDRPINESVDLTYSLTSYNADGLHDVADGPRILDTPLRMAGIDKVHALGIKGKGIKVGIIDTGIDHRHPALGAGFGPGKKIAGGYAWVNDNGSLVQSQDPLTTCFGGGHGTHVSGIVGMNPLQAPEGLPVTGVAPEAEIFMYRIFDCNGRAPGTDYIISAMLRGLQDKVDILSLSLAIGAPPDTGLGDPLADIIKKVTDAGVAVIVAIANDAGPSPFSRNIYTQEFPSTEPTAIAVGSVANQDFPLLYNMTDSAGANIQYASVWPIKVPELEVALISDPCVIASWSTAVAGVSPQRLNRTIYAFEVSEDCRTTDAIYAAQRSMPPFIMGYGVASTNPYAEPYNLPPQSRLGTSQFIQLSTADGNRLRAGLASAGKGDRYTIRFTVQSSFASAPQVTGGKMDYYSSFGPVRLTYDLKPQISAPGGNILSTFPLGGLGGYAIMSGTSMATPFLAGCYALVKSQFPEESMAEILERMQTTAKPMTWVFDGEMLSATAQQGAGLVDVHAAIAAQTRLSPGQLRIADNSKNMYGRVNITLGNRGKSPKTYKLSHRGAGFMNQLLVAGERNQLPLYGTVRFDISSSQTASISVAPGESVDVGLSILPPTEGVDPRRLPVFGGYVQVQEEDGKELSIPYSGPPYSQYNAESIVLQSPGRALPEIVYFYRNGTSVVVGDLLVVNNSMEWVSTAVFDLWTTAYRIDVVPANTTVVPTHFGFSRNNNSGTAASAAEYYQPPQPLPRATLPGGQASYGTLRNVTGLLGPSNDFSPSGWGGLDVVGDDRRTTRLEPGDYRWLLSVLRWGGDKALLQDWETWLSGVIRLVDGPAY
ncbi:hypothetical protein MAPG_03852 [Magnaporthiopsis poae ATCC 64411]|uniref:Minor extracellular protease vpr n=1 Tax=Magnaporthiopsis poae (strain ATCC 64411 / 73-15) TaxID=644358 RepID=A0A0C4DV52_MAGP6|nr:hypothetical protein MAPG_03852 [Magnaporthiopsis poae ATCC 64411]